MLVKNGVKDLTEAIALVRVMFDLYQLNENSERVQRFIHKLGKQSLAEFDLADYQKLGQAMLKGWQNHSEYLEMFNYCLVLMKDLQIKWDSPVIQKWIERQEIHNEGLTYRHLQNLIAALEKTRDEIEGVFS